MFSFTVSVYSVFFVRFVGEDGPESHFLGVVELKATDANTITTSLKKLLLQKKLDVTDMVAIATDGAAADERFS